MKKRLTILTIGVLVLLIIVTILLLRIKSDKSISETRNIITDIEQINIQNRAKLIIQDGVLIGESIKQLENGYYDFKLSNKNNILEISLNKLWYEEYGLDYIQDDYLAKICREIAKCIKNVEYVEYKEEFEYQLYKYIKDNYLIVKQGGNVEKINLGQISIWALCVNGECVINVKVE